MNLQNGGREEEELQMKVRGNTKINILVDSEPNTRRQVEQGAGSGAAAREGGEGGGCGEGGRRLWRRANRLDERGTRG